MNSQCEGCPAQQFCEDKQAAFDKLDGLVEEVEVFGLRVDMQTMEDVLNPEQQIDVPDVPPPPLDPIRSEIAMSIFVDMQSSMAEQGIDNILELLASDAESGEFDQKIEVIMQRFEDAGVSVEDLSVDAINKHNAAAQEEFEKDLELLRTHISNLHTEYDLPITKAACVSGPQDSTDESGEATLVCGSPNLTDRQRAESAQPKI